MKIVTVGHHCCIRLQKQAFALLDNGHEVHLVGHSLPSTANQFTTASVFSNVSQMYEILRVHKDADIIHIHNEPSWPVTIAKRALPGVPVVLDMHDSMFFRSLEKKHISAEERISIEMADGLVFVGERCREVTDSKKPSCVLPSYVNGMFYQSNSWQWIGGLVYEGRVDTPEQRKFMYYCNYIDFCKKTQEAELPFHVYCPGINKNKKFKEYYEKICLLHPALPYDKLLGVLGCHDWGLCGNLTEYREWQLAMPNKLFEYMAGGIPIIALNCGEIADFVVEHGVGIAVKSVEEMMDRWDERAECQKNVMLKREDFAMEKHIHILEDFYRELI